MKMFHFYLCLTLLTFAQGTFAQDVFARKTTAAAPADVTPQENARIELFRQQTERLAERVNAMQEDYARLEQRLSQVEPQLKTLTTLQNENAKLRDDVKTLRDELAQVKADRETMRKQISDDIAGRITTLINQQNASVKTQKTATETGRLHVVEAGQTLSEIARAYKTTVAIITKANNMTSADRLRIGQELFIPDP